jgi:hypothetical protein
VPTTALSTFAARLPGRHGAQAQVDPHQRTGPADLEFVENILAVLARSRQSDGQLPGNFPISQATCNQRKHHGFPITQWHVRSLNGSQLRDGMPAPESQA